MKKRTKIILLVVAIVITMIVMNLNSSIQKKLHVKKEIDFGEGRKIELEFNGYEFEDVDAKIVNNRLEVTKRKKVLPDRFIDDLDPGHSPIKITLSYNGEKRVVEDKPEDALVIKHPFLEYVKRRMSAIVYRLGYI